MLRGPIIKKHNFIILVFFVSLYFKISLTIYLLSSFADPAFNKSFIKNSFIIFPFHHRPRDPRKKKTIVRPSLQRVATLMTHPSNQPLLGNVIASKNQETIGSTFVHGTSTHWAEYISLGHLIFWRHPHLRCPPRLRQGGCSVACCSISQPIWRVAWWVRPHLPLPIAWHQHHPRPPTGYSRLIRLTNKHLQISDNPLLWSQNWSHFFQSSLPLSKTKSSHQRYSPSNELKRPKIGVAESFIREPT